MPHLTFTMTPRPPFRLDLTAWTLRRRAQNIIDRWDGQVYRRVLSCNGHTIALAVSQSGSSMRPRLDVEISGRKASDADIPFARAMLDRMLGLSVDLGDFYADAKKDKRLGPLAERFRGMRPPRYPSLFEALVNAIACQQMSLDVGIHLLNLLTAKYGRTATSGADAMQAFPLPQTLAKLAPEDLRAVKFSRQKARAIIELGAGLAAGEIDVRALEAAPDDDALAILLGLRGIGRWSAEYVLLRGLGRTHIFPGDDVGARRGLERWLGLGDKLPDYDSTNRALQRWRKYAGLVYFHLLLARLEREGALTA
jgi:DNA-3-methyladenine glycosylase II